MPLWIISNAQDCLIYRRNKLYKSFPELKVFIIRSFTATQHTGYCMLLTYEFLRLLVRS